jgi:hypothetical protein
MPASTLTVRHKGKERKKTNTQFDWRPLWFLLVNKAPSPINTDELAVSQAAWAVWFVRSTELSRYMSAAFQDGARSAAVWKSVSDESSRRSPREPVIQWGKRCGSKCNMSRTAPKAQVAGTWCQDKWGAPSAVLGVDSPHLQSHRGLLKSLESGCRSSCP